MLGAAAVAHEQGTAYTDAGATATDSVDGDITATITVGGDAVDENTAGVYTITYDVSDASNNPATQVTRVVTVDGTASASENGLASNLRIYPNPSASDFTFNINNYTNLSYKVYNFAGKLIKNGSFSNGINTLSMKNEANGLYLIIIRDNESKTSITKKFMKQ